MVGQETSGIARTMSRIALSLTLACAIAAPAMAQTDTPPDADQHCPNRPVLDGATPERDAELALPSEWTGFADMSMHWLAVRSQLGSVHCVETTWAIVADKYERLDDRFLGFDWSGYEIGGYMLIDTAGTGSSMDTGAKPIFSPNRSYFAAVQFSDAGWGGLEGFAVWHTFTSGMTPVHVDTNLRPMADWRIDKWEDEGCLHLSGVPYERVEDWRKLAEYERDRYVSRLRDGWKLRAGESCTDSVLGPQTAKR